MEKCSDKALLKFKEAKLSLEDVSFVNNHWLIRHFYRSLQLFRCFFPN